MPASRLLVAVVGVASVVAAACGGSACKQSTKLPPPPKGAAVHPRLWLTPDDVQRLRGCGDKPIFEEVLEPLAEERKSEMDAGALDNDECVAPSFETCETFAQLFAFMSLVHPEADARNDYARRARTLLLRVIDEAVEGPVEDHPLRDPSFSVDNRSRWSGEAFALTVDWIYPHLSADDKRRIRDAFLRWSAEQLDAAVTNHNHPVPKGVINDRKLVADRKLVRWAGNNYYTAHMRNLGLMAMAFDSADDPGDKLRTYLTSAAGSWMYVVDHLARTDARGGLFPEGLEYEVQTLSYAAQFLLALQTAGYAGAEELGPQTVMDQGGFWEDAVAAYLHAMSPARKKIDWRGEAFEPAWYGDGQYYRTNDEIDLFGPIGIVAARTGNETLAAKIRWLQLHVPPGGKDALYERARKSNPRQAILYALLAPDTGDVIDPRKKLPLRWFAGGLGHVYARTSWGADAAFFRYILGWIGIDHQHGEGNHFALYRNGEWLTKERTGYGIETMALSQFHNTLSVENDRPEHDEPGGYRYALWKSGSQWTVGLASRDPEIVARSFGDGYVFVSGDATGLYNSEYEGVRDVDHVSRSILWIEPDHVVVYDRAATKTEGRFKRFWLHVPRAAKVSGNRAVVTTDGGQKLVVTSLVPAGARIETGPSKAGDDAAEGDPMIAHIVIEPRPAPKSARFFTVLQGLDGGSSPDVVSRIRGDGIDGATVGDQAVVFPVDLSVRDSVSYRAPAAVKRHFVTGLEPDTTYTATAEAGTITVRKGGKGRKLRSDPGGVLVVK